MKTMKKKECFDIFWHPRVFGPLHLYLGFVRVLTLKIKSPHIYPLKGEVKSKIHPEAKFLEPWTFLCFFALFCPFWPIFWLKRVQT